MLQIAIAVVGAVHLTAYLISLVWLIKWQRATRARTREDMAEIVTVEVRRMDERIRKWVSRIPTGQPTDEDDEVDISRDEVIEMRASLDTYLNGSEPRDSSVEWVGGRQ